MNILSCENLFVNSKVLFFMTFLGIFIPCSYLLRIIKLIQIKKPNNERFSQGMSQNPASQKVKIYTFSAIILIAVAILLRTVNYLCIFDSDILYFANHPLHTIYRTLTILTVLWLLSMLIFIPRHSFSTKTVAPCSIFSRGLALFGGIVVFASFFFFRDCMHYYIAHAKFYQLLALLALPCAVYFFSYFNQNIPQAARALCGYMTLLWLGLLLSVTYLNLFVTMNSPLKISLHLAVIALMLHVLENIRESVGRPFRIHGYAYTLIAALLCGVASFPVIVAYLTKCHSNVDYLFYALLMLGFFLHLCARTRDNYRVLMVTQPASPEEIEEEKRAKEVKNKKSSSKSTENSIENDKGDDSHVS